MHRGVVWFGLVLARVMGSFSLEFVDSPPLLRSVAESQTRLPCQFTVESGEQVIQVSWMRERTDGSKEQIITAHRAQGQTEFGSFVNRVQFENANPTLDSTLLILSTEEMDETTFICHISTFPFGNFDRRTSLIVWTVPISSLEPVVLREGQSFRVAATCRAVARPPARITWETDMPGQSQNRSLESGAVTSHFSLHPLRNMNGRPLDCLVWHPTLKHPRRIRNNLVVQYPPVADIVGYTEGSWYVGFKGAELKCEGGGNPIAQNFTWTRKGGVFPRGVSTDGARLVFGWPLNLTDSGVYECLARNEAWSVRTEVEVVVSETARGVAHIDTMLITAVGAAAGVLVLIMVVIVMAVNCHHRRRNRKLKRRLTEKTEEIQNLSRQNSMRRLNSVSSESRTQAEDCVLIRLDSTMKNSVMSIEDRSVGSSRNGGTGTTERGSLGRQAIYSAYRPERASGRRRETDAEREERIRKVESYLRNSRISESQDSGLHRDQSPPPPSLSSVLPREGDLEGEEWAAADEIADGEWGRREGVTEGEESDNYNISEALSNHFQYSNGYLRPKRHSNAILMDSKGQII